MAGYNMVAGDRLEQGGAVGGAYFPSGQLPLSFL